MRRWSEAGWLFIAAVVAVAGGAKPSAGSLPAGRQHLLTIEGESTITFLPELGLDSFEIDYRARVEYLVDTRSVVADEAKAAEAPRKPARKAAVARGKGKGQTQAGANVAGSVNVALHSAELRTGRNGAAMMESRFSPARFQGRFQPEGPVLNVAYNEAPPVLQDVLKKFDAPAASILIDDRAKVVGRGIRIEGALHPVVETLLSIHTPIPRDVAFWEAPTQLAMGHGQTAKGLLRFEKEKPSKEKGSVVGPGGRVNVKVSGVLKAEGVLSENLVKDGTYTVTGDQTYDPGSREWASARWSVVVANELANPNGLTVARTRGTMRVESHALAESAVASP